MELFFLGAVAAIVAIALLAVFFIFGMRVGERLA